jgi:hypothetical protein
VVRQLGLHLELARQLLRVGPRESMVHGKACAAGV